LKRERRNLKEKNRERERERKKNQKKGEKSLVFHHRTSPFPPFSSFSLSDTTQYSSSTHKFIKPTNGLNRR